MATTYQTGAGSIIFGTESKSGYLVGSVTISKTPALVVSVTNELGQVVARRYDDVTVTISFDAIFNGATLPDPGETFSYDGETYEVTAVDEVRSNTDYKRVSIQGTYSEYIS